MPKSGQEHHNAKLTDREVELIREIHERGEMGYARLAAKFEVSKSAIQHIVTGRRR